MDLTAEIFVQKRIQYYHVYDTVYTEIHIFIYFLEQTYEEMELF